MKKLFLAVLMASTTAVAQTDVTKKYIENPDFGARFAAWVNPGSFTYNVANSFTGKSGQVWMEKWVARGSKLGNNDGIYQTLTGLPTGTYTLVAAAQNINQNATDQVCTGAWLYAGNEQVEVNAAGDYRVVFTVVNGRAQVGMRLKACTGNWVCLDNVRLYYNGENADSIAAEQTRVDAELAALREKVENANKTSLKVTTYDFVPTGNTIALGRSTISGTCAEKGYCWSSEGEPTIFDERTTETFENNGTIYVMRGLKPSTAYWVRPYAMTAGGYVAYGQAKKIVTLPAGNMTYGYDNAGDASQNARINSACAECIWMYNQLSYIPGFYLNVHYVYGAGAGDGTADCSYGGWMRVSQKEAYQQTGTILHETNHGVGVGTTGEWYNNSNLRAETSRGLWLGPMGTKMVRFFENSTTATMTGDGTHMWPYGINGAGEDRYQPSNHCLYFANILITHALHQDGLPSTSGVGFASPAYVFEQNDTTKYYIKNNDAATGMLTGYLYAASTGVKWNAVSAQDAREDDAYAWYIRYDARSRYYYFQNVGTGRMITYSTGFKLAARTSATNAEKFHLMPARVETTLGSLSRKFTGQAYWILQPNKYKSQALEATANGITSRQVDLTNGATRQQWFFLTADEMDAFDRAAMVNASKDFTALYDKMSSLATVPHRANSAEADLDSIDQAYSHMLEDAKVRADASASPATLLQIIDEMKAAMIEYLAGVTPTDASQPFDLTFVIDNANFDTDAAGWSETPSWGSKCCEFYQKNFDFNQTTVQKMPRGTYELRVQAFQRPGTLDDIYVDYYTNEKDNVNAVIYAKSTKTAKIQNICAAGQTRSLGTGSIKLTNGMYIPNNMASAQSWFKAGHYDNSLMFTNSTASTIKFGIKSTANSGGGFWTLFDNFRLYYYGELTDEEITPVESLQAAEAADALIYDLTGRRVQNPTRGIYIVGGRKVMLR